MILGCIVGAPRRRAGKGERDDQRQRQGNQSKEPLTSADTGGPRLDYVIRVLFPLFLFVPSDSHSIDRPQRHSTTSTHTHNDCTYHRKAQEEALARPLLWTRLWHFCRICLLVRHFFSNSRIIHSPHRPQVWYPFEVWLVCRMDFFSL